MILITGGSGSGKSAFAEKLLSEIQAEPKYYIATMRPWDEECRQKIARHRAMRQEKGFLTREWYDDRQSVPHFETHLEKGSAVWECLSNFTANIMFGEDLPLSSTETKKRVLRQMLWLERQLTELLVVTNELFSSGGAEMKEYIRCMGECNQELAQRASAVIEVVYGIPIYHKGGRQCVAGIL